MEILDTARRLALVGHWSRCCVTAVTAHPSKAGSESARRQIDINMALHESFFGFLS